MFCTCRNVAILFASLIYLMDKVRYKISSRYEVIWTRFFNDNFHDLRSVFVVVCLSYVDYT